MQAENINQFAYLWFINKENSRRVFLNLLMKIFSVYVVDTSLAIFDL